MNKVFGILIVLGWASVELAAPSVFASNSSETCMWEMEPEEIQVFDRSSGGLKFGPKQIEYLRLNRDHLRTNFQRQMQTNIDREYYIYRELLGLLSDMHVFAGGESGAAKTAGSRLVYIPTQAGNSLVIPPSVYYIQPSPFTTDLVVKGRYDELTQRLVNDNTMIQFQRSLIDEVDKMPPQIGPAFNEVLNEREVNYGPIRVRANTRHMLFTSNQTPYGLMNAWRTMDPGNGEQNARAFVARIPIRVHVDNYARNVDDRGLLMNLGLDRAFQLAEGRLLNPMDRYYNGPARTIQTTDYGFSPVDFGWLKDVALRGGLRRTPGGLGALNELVDLVRTRYNQMAVESERQVMRDGFGSIYMPPSIQSNRDLVQNVALIPMLSLMNDLLMIDEARLPTEKLARALEIGIPVDASSAWRLQYHVLTGASGDARLEVSRPVGSSAPTYSVAVDNTALQAAINNPANLNELATTEAILKERQVFMESFAAVMERAQRLSQSSAAILAPLREVLGTSGPELHSAEEMIFRLRR